MVGRFLLAASALAAFAMPAQAQHVLVSFAGNINLAYFGGETGSIAGSFSYDPTSLTHDADGNFTDATIHFSIDSPILMSLYGLTGVEDNTGLVTFQSNWEGSGVDHMSFAMSISGHPYSQFAIDLNLPLGSFGDDSHLPLSVPGLDTPGLTNNIAFSDTYGDLSFGSLTSLSSTYFEGTLPPPPSVPEPASWAMMLVGFGLAGTAMRRRRSSVRFA